jgi:hypothetical protein
LAGIFSEKLVWNFFRNFPEYFLEKKPVCFHSTNMLQVVISIDFWTCYNTTGVQKCAKKIIKKIPLPGHEPTTLSISDLCSTTELLLLCMENETSAGVLKLSSR